MSGKLTKAMRAASWTGPEFAHARPSEDMTSLYSGERVEDMLDDDTLLLGAGGVAHSPVPSVPNSALLSTVSSANSLGAPATMSAAHAIMSRNPEGASEVAGPSQQDPGVSRSAAAVANAQARLRTTSPLAQASFNHSEVSVASSISYDSADDSSSFFTPPTAGRPRRDREIVFEEDVDVPLRELIDDDDDADVADSAESFDPHPSTSQMYQEEDEESEDEEEMPLEVRTRRPSASAADMSPPRRSVSARPGEPPHSRSRERDCEPRPMICT